MRNSVVVCLGALLFLPLFGAEHEQAGAKHGPRDVLWRLRQGNIAFVAGRQSVAQVTPARRVSLVAAQRPHAVVLTCADSRVPPEYIFNEGLGALFVVRVAGAVADPVTVGSVEYGVEHLHAPLIVVMGHTRCGAVKAAIETAAPTGVPTGPGANIESILTLIRPGIPKGAAHSDPWTTAVYGGVEQTMADLFRVSKIVPEMSKADEIGVIGAVYDIETGKVTFSEMLTKDKVEHAGEIAHLLEWKTVSRVVRRVRTNAPE
jgi:carbonic anhydrase